MEQTLQALAGILLKAVPTIVIVLLLHLYLKAMLFKPLEKVLQQRDEATGGARRAAEESLKRAEEKAAQFEAKLQAARADVYKDQEQARAKLLGDQESSVKDARARMETAVRNARAEIEKEVAVGRETLSAQSSALADQIADSVLNRRAS